jgi:cytochrome c
MKKVQELVKSQIQEKGPAFLLSVAIVAFAVIAANLLYQPKENLKRGFEVAIAVDGVMPEKAEDKSVDLATMMKTADITRGAKIFKKCASCHGVDKGGKSKVGPNLYKVVGRARASFAGFAYSDAMKAKGGKWDAESINQFIYKPKDFVPGTKMAFAGLKKPQDRADVILFIESQK